MKPRPLGSRRLFGTRPEVGSLVAHDLQAYRVMSIENILEVDWSEAERNSSHGNVTPYRIVLRPAQDDQTWTNSTADLHARVSPRMSWDVLPEHYAVCVHCSTLLPCRHTTAQEAGEAALKRMERYETPGICPACSEPISARQKSITFQENVELLLGPPVTFHRRRECLWHAERYERKWAAVDPTRKTTLSCVGKLVNHGDGTYECSTGIECPSAIASHWIYTVCHCCTNHPNGCHPQPNAFNRALTEQDRT